MEHNRNEVGSKNKLNMRSFSVVTSSADADADADADVSHCPCSTIVAKIQASGSLVYLSSE